MELFFTRYYPCTLLHSTYYLYFDVPIPIFLWEGKNIRRNSNKFKVTTHTHTLFQSIFNNANVSEQSIIVVDEGALLFSCLFNRLQSLLQLICSQTTRASILQVGGIVYIYCGTKADHKKSKHLFIFCNNKKNGIKNKLQFVTIFSSDY